MGLCGKVTFLVFTVAAVFIGLKLNALFEVPPVPKLEDTWWGPGEPRKIDTAVKPFKINVPEKVLIDLNNRLKNARPFTEPLEGVKHNYGINTKLLSEIVDFWKSHYDWRQRERFLNKFPQFKTNVQGLDIHFIHVKPSNANGLKVLPLMLLHGWPGSVREFYDVIPKLTAPQKDASFVFEVIVPSLPGYGFSDGAAKPGLGPAQMSRVLRNLMLRLGFEKFYVHGGDWGALVTSNMVVLHPENVLGGHSTMCSHGGEPLSLIKYFLGSFYPSWVVDKKYEKKMYPISEVFQQLLLEMGYMHLQATKPDTVGVALNDSPVGLAAYILEKFITWTNTDWKNLDDGGLKNKYSYVDLLDNVMIYWVSNSITTSMRLYAEQMNKSQMGMKVLSIPTDVPFACARFAHELAYTPDCLLTNIYKNLVHSSDYDDGGHFAAFEVPDLLARDVWIAIRKMEEFYKKQK